MIDEKLINFTRAYHIALAREFLKRGRHTFPHHGDDTQIIAIFKALDGFATFYLPAPDEPRITRGYQLFDYSEYSLNRICQSLSVHRLQVAEPELGESWDKPIHVTMDEE